MEEDGVLLLLGICMYHHVSLGTDLWASVSLDFKHWSFHVFYSDWNVVVN